MTFQDISNVMGEIINGIEGEIIKRSGFNNYNSINIELISRKIVKDGVKLFIGEITIKSINIATRIEENFIPPIREISFNDLYNYNEYRNGLRSIFNYEVLTESDEGKRIATWLLGKEELINIIREFKREEFNGGMFIA